MASVDETEDEWRVPEWTRGDRLRKARELAGLNQEEMGVRLSDLNGGKPYRHSTIAAWESGAQPRDLLAVIQRWSEITRVDPSWLLAIPPNAHNPRYGNIIPVVTPLSPLQLFDPDVRFEDLSIPRSLELVKS